jgi:hypothetical protein
MEIAGTDSLLQHIQFRLTVRKHCIVSERELERAWPYKTYSREVRERVIMEFANANGLSAKLLRDGMRVKFKKSAVS